MKNANINALTVDVEEHFQVAALKEAFDPRDWSSQQSRVDANTGRLLDLMGRHGVQGTFFVLGWVAERHPDLIRRIAAAGHELACHGQSHQLIYSQEPAVFREETLRAKNTLEDIAGVPVHGYRAASYSITPASVWALDVITEAGFQYDSSIVPVRHDFYGFTGAPALPHILRLPDGLEIREFPPSTIRIAGQRLPIGGGGYFRLFPYWFSRWGLRKVNHKYGQPFTFYTHPWEVDPQQPRAQVSWKSRFRHYVNLEKCEPRLDRLLGDFRFSTMRAVLDSLDLPVVELQSYAEQRERQAA
ncbi:XrtA system polysaccharide deacetylase [Lentisalinibacter sediminis]|uniref:XrtA system polysaccharide deacetylase n=1 Tax=Lentisalinibacter sediminis TaxID=2992237 RepID=UPI003867E9FC